MKKIIFLVISIFGLSIISYFLLSENNKEANNTEFFPRIVLGSEPSSMDPAKSLTIDTRAYLASLFEGLTNLDEYGNLEEGVAYEWSTNSNNTEYIFELRENALWSDGSPVTANDFKYSWLRVLNPETASGWASYLYHIQGAEKYNNGEAAEDSVGIEVLDSHTLKVILENPCSFFASMTSLQPYYPVKKEVIDSYGDGWTENVNTYISNGAFLLNKWEHDSEIVVSKNDYYWDKGGVKLSGLEFKLFSDSSAVMNSYEAGVLDYVGNILTVEEMQQISEIKNSDFVITKFIALNLGSPLFNNSNIRKAIALALNRDEITKMIGGQAKPLLRFIPCSFYNEIKERDCVEYGDGFSSLNNKERIEEASSLVKSANIDTNKKIIYLTNTSSLNVILAEVIKNQLSQIGLEVEIMAVEKKTFNSYRKEKKYDIVAASWAAEYPDITSYLYGFKSSDLNNYPGFKSNEFDDFYNDIMSESDVNKRFEIAFDAEDLVLNSYSAIPLYYENTAYISNNILKGYFYDITGCLKFINAYY
jgi:oligopeptide transport system substrate-binding protein